MAGMDPGFVLLYVFFSLTVFAPLGGLIGHYARNRPGDGAVLGFLFGPLGWLLILPLADCRRRCEHCHGVVDMAAKVCAYCATDIAPSETPKGAFSEDIIFAISAAIVMPPIMTIAVCLAWRVVGFREPPNHMFGVYLVSASVVIGLAWAISNGKLSRRPPPPAAR
jgi:hypothetical protein